MSLVLRVASGLPAVRHDAAPHGARRDREGAWSRPCRAHRAVAVAVHPGAEALNPTSSMDGSVD